MRFFYFFDANLNSVRSANLNSQKCKLDSFDASLNSQKRKLTSNLNFLKHKLEFSKLQTLFFRYKTWIYKNSQVFIKRREYIECASLIQCPGCVLTLLLYYYLLSNLAAFFVSKVLSYYSVKNYSHMYSALNAEKADIIRIMLI